MFAGRDPVPGSWLPAPGASSPAYPSTGPKPAGALTVPAPPRAVCPVISRSGPVSASRRTERRRNVHKSERRLRPCREPEPASRHAPHSSTHTAPLPTVLSPASQLREPPAAGDRSAVLPVAFPITASLELLLSASLAGRRARTAGAGSQCPPGPEPGTGSPSPARCGPAAP
jgi:hypothetical protein